MGKNGDSGSTSGPQMVPIRSTTGLDTAALEAVRGEGLDRLLEGHDQVRQLRGGQRELLVPYASATMIATSKRWLVTESRRRRVCSTVSVRPSLARTRGAEDRAATLRGTIPSRSA